MTTPTASGASDREALLAANAAADREFSDARAADPASPCERPPREFELTVEVVPPPEFELTVAIIPPAEVASDDAR